MFERFTADARRTVLAARAHAERLGHRPVGTEHLLLALVDTCPTVRHAVEGTDVAALVAQRQQPDDADRTALASLGIDLDRVRAAADRQFGPGALTPRHRRRRRSAPSGVFSPRAKTVLELSLREALRLRQREITSEHLALGLLREGRGQACAVLAEARVDTAALRRTLDDRVRAAAAAR